MSLRVLTAKIFLKRIALTGPVTVHLARAIAILRAAETVADQEAATVAAVSARILGSAINIETGVDIAAAAVEAVVKRGYGGRDTASTAGEVLVKIVESTDRSRYVCISGNVRK